MRDVSSMIVLVFLFNIDVHLNEQNYFFYAIIITVYVNNFYVQTIL